MDTLYTLDQKIGYFQVDLNHRIQLSALFKLFQEAAIHHANQYQIGTSIMEDKGESWILNRVTMQLKRYPVLDEAITIQTWATRLAHFKGFREFRVVSKGEVIGQVSTLWLYINLERKAFTRLPIEIETSFPVRPDDIYYTDLDRLRLPRPGDTAQVSNVSLRYTDMDGNQHVNNAAYLDILQTGLYHQKLNTRPHKVEIQFAREIPSEAIAVEVKLEPGNDSISFSLGTEGQVAAFGCVSQH